MFPASLLKALHWLGSSTGAGPGPNTQGPVPGIILIILSLRWAGGGPAAVCWFLALDYDRFTPC